MLLFKTMWLRSSGLMALKEILRCGSAVPRIWRICRDFSGMSLPSRNWFCFHSTHDILRAFLPFSRCQKWSENHRLSGSSLVGGMQHQLSRCGFGSQFAASRSLGFSVPGCDQEGDKESIAQSRSSGELRSFAFLLKRAYRLHLAKTCLYKEARSTLQSHTSALLLLAGCVWVSPSPCVTGCLGRARGNAACKWANSSGSGADQCQLHQSTLDSWRGETSRGWGSLPMPRGTALEITLRAGLDAGTVCHRRPSVF